METIMEQIAQVNALVWILGAGICLTIGNILGKRSKKEGSGFLEQVFTNNKELDTTIRYVGILLLAFTMVVFFSDDIKSEAGIIIVSLFNCILAGNGNGNGNGHTKE